MAHTNWYRYGTISINQNSNHVIGLNTRWADIGIKSGDVFTLDGTKIYEVDTVTDNTNLTLKTAFEESNRADVHYCIIRNFTDISTADIVAQMSELRVEMKTYIDTEMSTLQGKSAYEIAQDNGFIGTESEWLASLNAYGVAKKGGYTGTESEWLNSLKAAGEWEEADTRISTLESNLTTFNHIRTLYEASQYSQDGPGYLHKQIYRGKNLGSAPTAAQYAAIRNGTYDDIFLGDYWEFPMDITFPLLNEADPENGDTWVNETEPAVFNNTVKWIIVDIGRLVMTDAGHKDPYTGAGLSYANTFCNRNVVLMPNRSLGSFPMNYKNSNECGYTYSLVNTKILPAIYDAIKDIFRLRAHSISKFVNSTDSDFGKAEYIMLPSKRELNEWSGNVADFTSSVGSYGSGAGAWCTPAANEPFALFSLTKQLFIGFWGWTRDIAVRNGSRNTKGFLDYAGEQTYGRIIGATAKTPVFPYIVVW